MMALTMSALLCAIVLADGTVKPILRMVETHCFNASTVMLVVNCVSITWCMCTSCE
jgi:hypothetical protein